jgi:hypothetical protein
VLGGRLREHRRWQAAPVPKSRQNCADRAVFPTFFSCREPDRNTAAARGSRSSCSRD